MATITDIKQQQRRKERLSIYLDAKYAFSLSEEQFMEAKLAVGQELTATELARLVALSDFGKAIDRVYNLLSYRDRSIKEVRDYFRHKQFEDDAIAAIIEYFTSRQLLDDTKFAQAWVEDRQRLGNRSQRQLQSELRAKGIDNDTIQEALVRLGESSEPEALQRLIIKRNLTHRYPDKQKLTAHLVGKGFSYGTVKSVLILIAESEKSD